MDGPSENQIKTETIKIIIVKKIHCKIVPTNQADHCEFIIYSNYFIKFIVTDLINFYPLIN